MFPLRVVRAATSGMRSTATTAVDATTQRDDRGRRDRLPGQLTRLRIGSATARVEQSGRDDRRGERNEREQHRRRRGDRGGRIRRHVRARADPASRIQRRRARGCGRRWRHVVLEPLSRRPLRHPQRRLLLQLGPRAARAVAVVRALRRPTRDPALRPVRRRQARSPSRHPVQHPCRLGRVGRRHRSLDDPHRQRPRRHRAVLRHGHGLLVDAEGARHRGHGPLHRRGLLHQYLATRRRRLHRQARRGDRHRLVSGAVDPADRSRSRPAHGVPTHAELLDPGTQRAHLRRAPGTVPRRPGGLPRGGSPLGGWCPA